MSSDPVPAPDQRRKSRKNIAPRNTEWATPKGKFKFVFAQTWRFWFTLLVPILLLPIFFWKPIEKKAPYGVYLILIMASFWISECLPLAITSLIPIVLLPLFGLTDSDVICSVYFNNTIIFLFGGCVIALAFEYSNLHTRITFFVMKFMGAQASILLFGMMITCTVLSCWMNNTSTTAMMVPCIAVIMEQYKKKLLPVEDPHELAALYGDPNRPPLPDNPATTDNGGVKPDADGHNEDHSISVDIQTSADARHASLQANDPSPSEHEVPRPSFVSTAESMLSTGTNYWEEVVEKKQAYLRKLEIMFLIGVAFSSNIGGTGVITGTGTNLIATSQLRTAKADIMKKGNVRDTDACTKNPDFWDLDFVRWVVLNMLPMVVTMLLTWAFLAIYYQGLPKSVLNFWQTKIRGKQMDPYEIKLAQESKDVSDSIRNAIKMKYNQLGKTTFHEWVILILFTTLVLLWMLRNPLFARGDTVHYNYSLSDDFRLGIDNATVKLVHPNCWKEHATLKLETTRGWSRFFGDKCNENWVHDTVSTLFICMIMFILPRDPIYYKTALQGGIGLGIDDPILPFSFVAEHIPWAPFLMLGGGFGISQAITDSELDDVLGRILKESETLAAMDVYVLLALLLFGVAVMTTIASNTATAAIISPVLIQLAQVKHFPPMFLLIPPIIGASYAFCLPISTPPNSIVYDKGNMKQSDMFVPGLFVSIITNLNLYLFTLTYTKALLHVDSYDGVCDILDTVHGKNGSSSGGAFIARRNLPHQQLNFID